MKKYEHWQIAYRLKGEKKFKLISNPSYAWAADPFLVEYQGHVFLFAELYLYRSERNGVIGYCEYREGEFGEWTVTMDKHWHLSYPNVFVYENKLYMCPESYQREEIGIYELESFPDKWRKVQTWNSNQACVDTTFIIYNGVPYMFTFELGEKKCSGRLLAYQLRDKCLSEPVLITEDISLARPGGNFIMEDGKLFRVGQDCSATYGAGLTFCEVERIWPAYKESVVRRLYPKDIEIGFADKRYKRKYTGLHTYNRLNGLEVIDLKYETYSREEKQAQKRVREVFLNKYE